MPLHLTKVKSNGQKGITSAQKSILGHLQQHLRKHIIKMISTPKRKTTDGLPLSQVHIQVQTKLNLGFRHQNCNLK